MFKTIFFSALAACVFMASSAGAAFNPDRFVRDGLLLTQETVEAFPTQSGMSLSQAVDSVRRRGNVERIISAQTRVRGDREVHEIRYQTKDGRIRTESIPGVRRSARRELNGGREVHIIKVLTKDGRVQTHRLPGRKRD